MILNQNFKLQSQTFGNGALDADGNFYQSVIIGNQEWLASNIRATKFSNGDSIVHAINSWGVNGWASMSAPAWCWFSNDSVYEIPYGKLYNGYVVNDPRNICPVGWHVPNNEDWLTLENFAGGSDFAGGKLKIEGLDYWIAPNAGATDEYGYSAVGAEYRNNIGSFEPNIYAKVNSLFWTSTQINQGSNYAKRFSAGYTWISTESHGITHGFSVRCMRAANNDCGIIINDDSICQGQQVTLNANINSDTITAFSIGDTGPAGGVIFYDKGNNNNGWRYLEAATSDLDQATWGCNGVVLQNTNGIAIGTGLENTNNIVAQCAENSIAAKLCFDFTSNGYDDWFLPSRDELFQLYSNRTMVGGFNPSGYWTSTQQPVPFPLPDYAYFQSFEDVPVCCNGLYNTGKNQLLRVRPIRRVSELSIPTYLWSTGETTPSITVSPIETTTYTLTVTQGSETCTDQVSVTVLPSPTVEISSNSPLIEGATLQLNATSNPGSTFFWTGPNNFNSTEQNPIVTNTNALNSGIYAVTPTLNGCLGETVSINAEIIPSGNLLTLYMDTVPGINGQETLVNMRVRNFTNILSAQFTLQFDPTVASYSGFTNPAIASINGNSFGQTQIANGVLTFAWSQPNVTPVTLSDGTVLFTLRFQVAGIGGTFTPIQFVNSPTPLEFVDQSFIPLSSWAVNPGRIEVLNLSSISGSLNLPNGVGIRSATISASGFSDESVQSAINGTYSINLPEGQLYTISPSKGNDTLVANGITTLDVILIQRHILGTLLLNSPYKIIAGDVNLSGTVTSADINLINAIILANINQYPSGLFWSFVPDDYIFSSPNNPFPFPSSRNYPSISGAVNEDYFGVKLGDVNYSYNNALARLSAATDSVSLYIENKTVQEESTINVPIRVKNFSNMAGFQLALEWNPQVLSFNEVNSNNGGLAVNVGATQSTSGLLNINWIDPNSSVATIEEDSSLFVITFDVIGAVGTNSAINIVSSPTAPIELINENLEVAAYGILNGNIEVNIPSSTQKMLDNQFKIYPNPVNDNIQISCEACLHIENYTMSLFNSIGQIVYQIENKSFPTTFSIDNSLSNGLYFFVIEDRKTSLRTVKRVQIIKQ